MFVMAFVPPWNHTFPPFKLFGNLYFCGSKIASSHVVDTGEGLIMFDTGYGFCLYQLIDGMYRLGLNPYDLKLIFHTHGHIDHFGGTKALVEMTGAKTLIGALDKEAATGEKDLSFAKELGMEYNEKFIPDILLNDGDEITLGNTTVKAMATPGHTEGAMSYFFNVTDGKNTYRAGLQGGMGMNTLSREYLEKFNIPLSIREDYIKGMDRIKKEHVDIHIGNHLGDNHAPEKYEKLMAGDEKAFINPLDWAIGIEEGKKRLYDLLEKEQKA